LKWSISESTPAGAATVNAATGLVTAIKGGTVTVRATALDGSSTYGEIILEISGTSYPMDPIIGLNGTYNTYCYSGAGIWMIENSKEGTPTYTREGTNYYTWAIRATACPAGWRVPTRTQFTSLGTNRTASDLSAWNTVMIGDYDGTSWKSGGAYWWSDDTTNGYVRIESGGRDFSEKANAADRHKMAVRCIKQ
jgi:hypothetical protein